MVLVHGFGASGSQFNQTTQSLAKNLYSSLSITLEDADTILEVPKQSALLVAAPDLIGFGQSEKPCLTYTQYLWESFVASFTQDIILNPHLGACDSFVIGGNSIGGYTAMAVAADDSRHVDVSSSGAFGSSKCTGLILMNSAGRLYSREELLRNNKNQAAVSVTEQTALDMLGSSR
jgi:pimeloyl-ACP methyl ester carboxylesterase